MNARRRVSVAGLFEAAAVRALGLPLLGLLPVLGIVAVWTWAAGTGRVSPALLPSPAVVLARIPASLADPSFRADFATTLWRLLAGFGIALALGTVLGVAAATNRIAGAVLRPLVRVLAPVPKIALYPALVLALGFDSAPKIVLVAADAVFPVLLAAHGGALRVDPKLVWSALAAGTSPRWVVPGIVLPAALPSILTGARIALVVSCVVVFLAEMIASTDGLGYRLVRAARNFQTADMFVPLFAIAAVGLALDLGVGRLRRALLAGWEGE